MPQHKKIRDRKRHIYVLRKLKTLKQVYFMDPPTPLLKAERTKCYKARDEYFKCLNDTIDDRKKCAHLLQPMKDLCPEKWVSSH